MNEPPGAECRRRRALTSANRLVADLAIRGEKYLDKHEIRSRDRLRAKVTFRPAGPTTNAYRFKSISTEIELTRGGKGWYLTGVKRAPVYPRAGERFLVTISDRAMYSAIKRVLVAFGSYALPPGTLAEAATQLAPKNCV